MGTVRRCWVLQEGAGHCRKVLDRAGHCKKLLGTVGTCVQWMADTVSVQCAGICRKVPGENWVYMMECIRKVLDRSELLSLARQNHVCTL